jgi:hypothetical protein
VTRYRVSQTLDPRENRLTEVTAATLEHVAGLPVAIGRALLEAGCRDATLRRLAAAECERRAQLLARFETLTVDRVSIATQVPTRSGRFVDLELAFDPPPGSGEPGLLLWVEVKHGADLHGNQLDAYLADMPARRPRERDEVLVLLGPRGWAPDGPTDVRVLRVDWQQVARGVAVYAGTLSAAQEQWLVSEYIRYLKEEGLSDPDALTLASAMALMEHENAADATAGICEHAFAYVEEQWGAATDCARYRGGDPHFGLDFWSNHRTSRRDGPHDERWDPAWFEWGLRYTPYLQYVEDDPRGSYAFIAGASVQVQKQEPWTRQGNEAWAGRRHADGFVRAWLDNYKLVRLRYPDELLVATTLPEQGRLLGQWVLDAFEALALEPPVA